MTKTLTRHGNSLASAIDKPILEQMGVDETTPLTLAFDGRCIIIARASSTSRRSAIDEIHHEFGNALKKLESEGVMEIAFLNLEDVLALHEELIQRYGGTPGLRDACWKQRECPQAGFGSQYFHEFPPEMAAAYLFHLVRNHAFIDGNKRVA